LAPVPLRRMTSFFIAWLPAHLGAATEVSIEDTIDVIRNWLHPSGTHPCAESIPATRLATSLFKAFPQSECNGRAWTLSPAGRPRTSRGAHSDGRSHPDCPPLRLEAGVSPSVPPGTFMAEFRRCFSLLTGPLRRMRCFSNTSFRSPSQTHRARVAFHQPAVVCSTPASPTLPTCRFASSQTVAPPLSSAGTQ
jgi:hypothetical protein